MIPRTTACASYQSVTRTSAGHQAPFKVRIDINRRFPEDLLQQLGAHAARRGVYRINILEAEGQLKFVRVTCQSMTIPIAVLDYVLENELPLRLLEQPELLLPGVDEGIFGNGQVLLLRGAAIGPKVIFNTRAGQPIVLRENSTLVGPLTVQPGTIVGPGQRLGPS